MCSDMFECSKFVGLKTYLNVNLYYKNANSFQKRKTITFANICLGLHHLNRDLKEIC